MKSILPHDFGQDWSLRLRNRQLAKTQIRVSGTPRKPPQPRGVRIVVQGGAPVLVWEKPLRAKQSDLVGYQVYQSTDAQPYTHVGDKNTTQAAVNIPLGKKVNFFLSAVNGFGESRKLHIQGQVV